MSTINVKLTLGDSTAEVELPNDTPFDDTAKLMAAIAEKVDADFDSKLASAGEALAFRINIGGDNHIDPAELKTMLGDAP